MVWYSPADTEIIDPLIGNGIASGFFINFDPYSSSNLVLFIFFIST